MGGLAETQLDGAIQALVKRDGELAGRSSPPMPRSTSWSMRCMPSPSGCWRCVSRWRRICARSSSALKISGDLERIADYAANAAKRVLVLNQLPPAKPIGRAAAGAAGAADPQGSARRLCRAGHRKGAPRSGARTRRWTNVHRPVPRTDHLHDGGCAQYHRLHPSDVHRQEYRADRRPCDQHRGDDPSSGQRRADDRDRVPRRRTEVVVLPDPTGIDGRLRWIDETASKPW